MEEKFECPECGKEEMHADGLVKPSGQQDFKCDACGYETSFP
jgi:predicted RNA-binding Zn-ribbon protein involved in translation (DUF1610 family)